MINMKSSLPTIVGTIAGATLFYLTSDFTMGTLLQFPSQLGLGVATNLLSGVIRQKKIFQEKDPSKLNHSIKKLFVSSMSEALSYVYVVYERENNPEKKEKKEVYKLVKNIQKGLSNEFMNFPAVEIDDNEIRKFLY